LENLDIQARLFHSSSLLSYNKNTTQVQFSSHIPLPSSPFSEICLD
ncbi:8913_t:CDS:1, partial [Gigaspora margarita]